MPVTKWEAPKPKEQSTSAPHVNAPFVPTKPGYVYEPPPKPPKAANPHTHEKYPNLMEHVYELYPRGVTPQHFEEIINVLETYFSDIFNLPALEHSLGKEIKHDSAEFSDNYKNFFNTYIKDLHSYHGEVSILKDLYWRLLEADIFPSNYLYVPDIGSSSSLQLGFLEKFARGQLSEREPLTLLDMQRAIKYIRSKKSSYGYGSSSFVACQVNQLARLLTKPTVAIVNVGGLAMPKWCVVQLKQKNGTKIVSPIVYCETSLTSEEARALSVAVETKTLTYAAGAEDAELSASTGYMALAWLVRNLVPCTPMTLYSDFADLIAGFVVLMDDIGEYDLGRSKFEARHYSMAMGLAPHEERKYQRHRIVYAFVLDDLALLSKLQTEFPVDKESSAYTQADLKEFYQKVEASQRTCMLGLDQILVEKGFLAVEVGRVCLQALEIAVTDASHIMTELRSPKICDQYNITKELADIVTNRSGDVRLDMLAAMLFSTIRARAKQRHLSIQLPDDFTLFPDELKLVQTLLSSNAYIQEIDTNHAALTKCFQALKPTLARNHLSAKKGYRPAMGSDHWRAAAKGWLRHLSEYANVAALAVSSDVNDNNNGWFAEDIRNMGLAGYVALLKYLTEDKSECEILCQDNSPPFYFDTAANQEEIRSIVHLVTSHVSASNYFPFQTAFIKIQLAYHQEYLPLLSTFNSRPECDEVILEPCLSMQAPLEEKGEAAAEKSQYLKQFLVALVREACAKNWTTTIIIPELEKLAVDHRDQHAWQLLSAYRLLNNVILFNRRKGAKDNLREKIMPAKKIFLVSSKKI